MTHFEKNSNNHENQDTERDRKEFGECVRRIRIQALAELARKEKRDTPDT